MKPSNDTMSNLQRTVLPGRSSSTDSSPVARSSIKKRSKSSQQHHRRRYECSSQHSYRPTGRIHPGKYGGGMDSVTRAEVAAVACAELFRGDGEIVVSPMGLMPSLGARLARLTFEPDILLSDG